VITVTERAKEELKTILIAAEAEPDEGLRLLPTPDGKFILAVDTELLGDQVAQYEGFKVLLVGMEYFNILDGKTVDCHDTEDGPVLVVG
jgi:Fe-S cluster assembly iron-binding protein IscA